jgi:hypothetical protein
MRLLLGLPVQIFPVQFRPSVVICRLRLPRSYHSGGVQPKNPNCKKGGEAVSSAMRLFAHLVGSFVRARMMNPGRSSYPALAFARGDQSGGGGHNSYRFFPPGETERKLFANDGEAWSLRLRVVKIFNELSGGLSFSGDGKRTGRAAGSSPAGKILAGHCFECEGGNLGK